MIESYNQHFPVMLDEVVDLANLTPHDTVVDLTLGRAGHSAEFLKRIPHGFLYGVDRDQTALGFSFDKLAKIGSNFKTIYAAFSSAPRLLQEQESIGGADFIFCDLGVSSPQFDDPLRGFSYRYDAPLDMRMDQLGAGGVTAATVVNTYRPAELVEALYLYADEKYAKPIVHSIVKHRETKMIETTFELVDIIKESLPEKELRKPGHPAKKTFLAIRYLVNSEMTEIKEGIPAALRFLNPGGRMEVLTFNSYEDGLVKNIFKNFVTPAFSSKYLPPERSAINYRLLTKKPLAPSAAEVEKNNRSKPAKLRAIERIS